MRTDIGMEFHFSFFLVQQKIIIILWELFFFIVQHQFVEIFFFCTYFIDKMLQSENSKKK